jgi:hypothetical protein
VLLLFLMLSPSLFVTPIFPCRPTPCACVSRKSPSPSPLPPRTDEKEDGDRPTHPSTRTDTASHLQQWVHAGERGGVEQQSGLERRQTASRLACITSADGTTPPRACSQITGGIQNHKPSAHHNSKRGVKIGHARTWHHSFRGE